MSLPFFLENLKSNYCKVVFVLAFALAYVITPKHLLQGRYLFIAVPYFLLFSFSMACMVRVIKERAKSSLIKGGSVFSFLIGVVGLSALQVCGLGTPLCGASIGFGILSMILPRLAFEFLTKHGLIIVLLAMLLQIVGLYSMKCFQTKHFEACDKK